MYMTDTNDVYKKLISFSHPDRNKDPLATKMSQLVNILKTNRDALTLLAEIWKVGSFVYTEVSNPCSETYNRPDPKTSYRGDYSWENYSFRKGHKVTIIKGYSRVVNAVIMRVTFFKNFNKYTYTLFDGTGFIKAKNIRNASEYFIHLGEDRAMYIKGLNALKTKKYNRPANLILDFWIKTGLRPNKTYRDPEFTVTSKYGKVCKGILRTSKYTLYYRVNGLIKGIRISTVKSVWKNGSKIWSV